MFFCVDLARGDRASNLQGTATIIFAIPFILLSGYCGYLSDFLRQNAISLSLARSWRSWPCCLGWQHLCGVISMQCSACCSSWEHRAHCFGPSKYGILPELFAEEDLPRVNGAFLMTTFLAIIFGFSVAGFLKEGVGDQLWMASLVCIGIAIVGTGDVL